MPNEDLNSTPNQTQPIPPVTPTDYNSSYYNANDNQANQALNQPQFPDYTQDVPPSAPSAVGDAGFYDNLNTQDQSSFSDYTQQPSTYPDPSLNTGYNNDYPQTGNLDNTAPVFEEKKSGNKTVVYGAIGLLVVLVIAAGVLLWLNFGQATPPAPENSPSTSNTATDNNTSSNNNNSTNNTPTTTSPTGGPNTPATKARVFNETRAPKTWLQQKFTNAVVDTSGNCIVANVCSDSSDPDNDGLTNIEEYNFQTDPQNEDTDNDGVSDGDETYVYYSDPTKDDSDGDTFKDGAELAGCFDPIANESTRFSQARLADITTQIGLRPLHNKTKVTLTTAGATTGDVATKGIPSAKCVVTPAATVTPPPAAGITLDSPVAPPVTPVSNADLT